MEVELIQVHKRDSDISETMLDLTVRKKQTTLFAWGRRECHSNIQGRVEIHSIDFNEPCTLQAGSPVVDACTRCGWNNVFQEQLAVMVVERKAVRGILVEIEGTNMDAFLECIVVRMGDK